MKNKNLILKIICPFIVVLLASIILLVIFLPKQNNEPLTIVSDDITLDINEESKIIFEVSNPYAVVTFDIEDEKIVSLNGFTIKGLKEGETTINLLAQYNSQTATCQCKVIVVDEDTSTTQPDDSDDSSSSTPSDNDDESENPDTGEDNEDSNSTEDDETINNNYIKFEIINQNGCQIDGTNITLSKDKTCYFQLLSDEFENWQDCSFSTTNNIQISKLITGFNSWKIIAQENGTIKINYQGQTIGIINIFVL